MLTALHLGNFKAFGETQRIPIKPLTLIFGPNTAGKSSLLHGLLAGSHILRKGDYDMRQALAETVELGGFDQFVHGANRNNCVTWGMDLEICQLGKRIADALAPHQTVSIAVEFGKLKDTPSRPRIGTHRFAITTDATPLLRMEWAHTSNCFETADEDSLRTPPAQREFAPRSSSSPVTFWIQGDDVAFSHPTIQAILRGSFQSLAGCALSSKDLKVLESKWEDVCDFPTAIGKLVPEGLNMRVSPIEKRRIP